MAQTPQNDPYAAIAQPVQAANPYAAIAEPAQGASPMARASAPAPTEKPGFLTGLEQGLTGPFLHPIRTIEGAIQPFRDILPSQSVYDGIPVPVPNIEGLQHGIQQVNQIKANPAYAAGGLTGDIALGAILGGALKAPGGLEDIGTEGMNTLRNIIRPSASPDIVPRDEMSARVLASHILPAEGVTPNLIKNIQNEAPAILEYAKRTNNPLNTQIEGLKAAQGVAEEGLNHFNNNILKPFEDVRAFTGVENSPLGSSATLKQIENRIGEINDLQRRINARARSGGQAMTEEEALGLEKEGKALRNALYNTLSEKSGIPAEQLRDLREGYGGQFGIKNALESAGMKRLERTGAVSQGAGAFRPPMSVGELPGAAWRAIRGGEQAIADRQFARGIREFQPKAPIRPVLNPPEAKPFEPITQLLPPRPNYPRMANDVPFEKPPIEEKSLNGPFKPTGRRYYQDVNNEERAARAAQNREAAKMEAVRMHELQNAAQDAARERAQRAAEMRKGLGQPDYLTERLVKSLRSKRK